VSTSIAPPASGSSADTWGSTTRCGWRRSRLRGGRRPPGRTARHDRSVPVRSLSQLALAIRDEVDAADREFQSAVQHATKAGELLIEAKGKVGHGGWLPWLRENFSGSVRSAQGYMRLAADQANAQRVAHLGIKGAPRELAARPEPPPEPESLRIPPPAHGAELPPIPLPRGVKEIDGVFDELAAGKMDLGEALDALEPLIERPESIGQGERWRQCEKDAAQAIAGVTDLDYLLAFHAAIGDEYPYRRWRIQLAAMVRACDERIAELREREEAPA